MTTTNIRHLRYNIKLFSLFYSGFSEQGADVMGQTVHEQSCIYEGGMCYRELDMTGQPTGVYFVELQTDGQKLMLKLVEQEHKGTNKNKYGRMLHPILIFAIFSEQ